MANHDFITSGTLGALRALRSPLCTLTVTCFIIIRFSQVFQLLLRFFLLLIHFHLSSCLLNTDLSIIVDLGAFLRGCGPLDVHLLGFIFLIDQALVLHTCLIIARVLLFLVHIILLFISDTVELLEDLIVFECGALCEGLAAIINHDNLLRLVSDIQVAQRSVRIDYVSFYIVLLCVEPFPMELEQATTVDENEAGDGLGHRLNLRDLLPQV